MIRLPSVSRKRTPKKRSSNEFNYVIKPKVIKICVVGEINSGKTSLIRKYLYGDVPRHYQGVIGYDFDIKLLNRQNKDVRLEIFDTGHPIYNDMILNCISVYSIEYIIICYDLVNKNSFKLASDWIKMIQDFGKPGRYKIVICGTKSDILDSRQKSIVATFLGNMHRNGTLGYYESSAKIGQNIYELFEFIIDDFISRDYNA